MNKECKIKGWVARDKNRALCVYSTCPHYNEDFGMWENEEDFFYINQNYFPEVKYNSDPIEVEITIKKI